jgi:hypothetical protein
MRLSNVPFRLARASRRPEFRIAVLLCLVWLFLVQAYQPWRYSRGYKSARIPEEAMLFFWRIGFNAVQSSPLALAIGLSSIVLLIYLLAWVVRSFRLEQIRTEQAQAPQRPFPDHSPPVGSGRHHAASAPQPSKLSLRRFGRHMLWFLGAAILAAIPLIIKTVPEFGALVPAALKGYTAPQETQTTGLGVAREGQQSWQPELTPDSFMAQQGATAVEAPAPSTASAPGTVTKPLAERNRGLASAPGTPTPEIRIPRAVVNVEPNHSKPAEPCRVALSDREQHRSPNGEKYAKERPDGLGKLTITNGNSEDAAVIVSNLAADTADRLVYVRAGTTTILRNISPGKYRLKFQIGKDWDDAADDFQCVTATAEFDRPASFQEEQTTNGIRYSTVNITLHKLVGGNARTTSINPAAFRRRRRH